MIAGKIELQMAADLARLSRDMDQARGMIGHFGRDVDRMVASMRAALGSIGAGLGLRELAQLTDQYTKYTAQLKLATQSEREYATAREEVRRIATQAQGDIAATGVLYARIANSTREMGKSQREVTNITETVMLALKASGATAQETASATLQLSQAFASGVLRGEEFNAVNEAAPRLMKALAEGMGVPIGSLREMAKEGKITSEVMANALPRAIEDLRKEAQQVQTIAGAWQVLKNNVMEYVGANAEANNVASIASAAIIGLARNLDVLTAALMGITAMKLSGWIIAVTQAVHQKTAALLASIQAQQAERAAAIASSQAEIVRAEATLAAITAARAKAVSDMQAAQATMAATAAVGAHSGALALNTAATQANSVAIAELASLGRLQASVTAQMTAAQGALTAAQGAGGAAATLASRALGLLGGPIGVITTVLGLGVTAWALWGRASEDANNQAKKSTEESSIEILRNLEKTNAKLRERLELVKATGGAMGKQDSPGEARMAELLKTITQLELKRAELKAQGVRLDREDQFLLDHSIQQYQRLEAELKTNAQLKKEIDGVGQQNKAGEWLAKYATNAEKLAAELKKAREELGDAFTPDIERRIIDQFTKAEREAAARAAEERREAQEKLRKDDIAGWVKSIDAQVDEYERGLREMAKLGEERNKAEEKLRKEDVAGWVKAIDAEIAEYERGLKAMGKLQPSHIQASEKASEKQWKGFVDGIESAFRDGFNNIGKGWKGALKAMRDALKRTLLDFIYQSFAKPFILNIVGNVAGMLGLNGLKMAARGAAGGNALNIGSTLLSGANFLTGGTAGAFISGMSLPTSAVGAAAINAGVGVSATSAAGMGAQFAAMMTNPVTIAIAAAAALAYFFRDKGENWTGQIGFGTNARAYASEGPFGRQGFVSLQGNDATNRAIQAFMASTTAIDRIIAATLNRSQIDQVIANLAAPYATRNDGSPAEFAFGKDDDTAPEQLTLEFLQAKYGRVFDVVDATFARFIREYKGTAEELIREISAFAGVLQGLKGLGLNGLDADALRAMQREGETLAQTFERVGGGWLQLVEAFTSDQTKLANAQKEVDALFSDLRAAGIDLPTTREGWLDVMRGLDLSTASGRALFERMLKLAPAFALVTDAAAAAVDAISGIARRAAGNALGFGRGGENTSMRIGANISAVRDNTVATEANTDANFSGVYGLTPAQVARNREIEAARNREIEAARKLAEAFEEARRAVAKYRADLLLDPNLSTLDPAQQLRISVDQFYQAWARAMAGDLGAIKDLPGLADIVLDLARTNYASDPRYVELFDWVRNMLGQVADAPAGENFNEKMLGYTERHVEIAEGTLNMLLNIRDNANANTAQLTAAVNGVAAAVRQTTHTVPR